MRFHENIDDNIHPDFIPRRYFKPLKQVLPVYLTSLAALVFSIQLQGLMGSMLASIAGVVVLTSAAAYLYYRLQTSNDIVMANEFQNMLFASAASLNSHFCIFVRNNGIIVYANEGTRKLFPSLAYNQSLMLDQLLDEVGAPKENAAKLHSAVSRNTKESLVVPLKMADGKHQDFIMIVDPMQRPRGYYMIYGRPYSTDRGAAPQLQGLLSGTSIEKIEALLAQLPVGVYLTNQTGVIEYANPAFEALMHYESGSLAAQGLTIQQLVYHADGVETGEFVLQSFVGDAMLSCVNKSLARVFLEQKRIPLSNNRNEGYLGIVTPVS